MAGHETFGESETGNVRVSLRTKLTLAFVIVSLIGFILAFWLLPRLYLNSKNREIELSKASNVNLLPESFAAWVRMSPAIPKPVDRAREAAELLRRASAFDFTGIHLDRAVTPGEAMEILSASRTPESLRSLAEDMKTIESLFGVARIIPWEVEPLTERVGLIYEGNPPKYYWPILVPLSLPERGFEGTLAFANFSVDPLELDPNNFPPDLFKTMQTLGLTMVSKILFFTLDDIRAQEGLEKAFENRNLPYWEESDRGDGQTDTRLYVPVRDVAKKDDLAGVFCLLYEPTANLPVWNDLVGGPGYAALGAAAFAAVIFSIFFARTITRPVQELTQGALAIAEGKLDRSVVVSTGDEIGVLADTFNRMTDRLRRTLDELRERAETIENQNLELDRRFNELRTLQNYTENILKTVESAIFSVDLSGNIRRPNRAACDLLGLEDGQSIEALESDALRDRLNAALELGESTVSDEMTVVSPSGDKVPVAVSVSPLREEEAILGSVAVLTDLQLIKNLEALVSRQERLAALGELTAGVAHEIRNPLSIIKACAEILQQKFGDHPDENGLCRDILEESNRLSRVVTDFLSFARPAEPSLSTLELNDTLDLILDRLQRENSRQTRIVRQFSEQPIHVEADADQVEQVLLNLIRNAEEAMGESGAITVRTGSSGEDGKGWFEAQDEGSGMDEETVKKIFNPFFTSKAEGTGLGLSICHRIMEAHRGSIEVVESSEAAGTLFRVTFPRTAERVINPLQGETARR